MKPLSQNKVLILEHFKTRGQKRDTIYKHYEKFKKTYPRHKLSYVSFCKWVNRLIKEKKIKSERFGVYIIVWYKEEG